MGNKILIIFRRNAERFIFWYMDRYSDARYQIGNRTHVVEMQRMPPGPSWSPMPRRWKQVA